MRQRKAGLHQERLVPVPAARIIARMPDLNAAGSVGHASTMVAKSASNGPYCAPSAPHSAPLCVALLEFPVLCVGSSIPAASTQQNLAQIRERASDARIDGTA